MKIGGNVVMTSLLATTTWSTASSFLPSSSLNGRSQIRRIAASAVSRLGGGIVPISNGHASYASPLGAALPRGRLVCPRLPSSSRLFSAVVESSAKPSTEDSDEDDDSSEELPTNESDPRLLRIRHTSAHVMAMAVQRLFPEAQVTIGPWIDNGFYYDFYFPPTVDPETNESIPGRKLTDADLKRIKKEMDKIISQDLPILREEVTREEARRRILSINEPFKLEILDSIKTEPITIYAIGDQWWDLCAGPHVETTGQLPKKGIDLTNVAGAYWRGDENREMLQRVYATAWNDAKQLKRYKKRVEEAKKRDHRILGKKLDLFSIQVGRMPRSFLFRSLPFVCLARFRFCSRRRSPPPPLVLEIP